MFPLIFMRERKGGRGGEIKKEKHRPREMACLSHSPQLEVGIESATEIHTLDWELNL